jgi:hypothetical protein
VSPTDAANLDAFARRLFAGVAAALAVVAVLAGCGGSSSPSSTTAPRSGLPSSGTPGATSTSSATSAGTAPAHHCDPTPCQLTHAELAARLDGLCLRANAAIQQADASFEQATNASDYTEAAAAMQSALLDFPPYQLVVQGLVPSRQDQATFTRYTDLTVRIHGLSEQIVAAGRQGDTPEAIRLAQLAQEQLTARTRAATDLGTKHCSR